RDRTVTGVQTCALPIFRLVQLLQLRLLLERLLESDTELEGNELRDPVHVAVAHAEHAADVAHDGLRGHGAVGDDLRDSLAPVFRSEERRVGKEGRSRWV